MTASFADDDATAALHEEEEQVVYRRPSSLRDGRYTPVLLQLPLLIVSAFVLWATGEPSTTLYISGVLGFITYVALAIVEALRAPLILSPLTFYFAWYSVLFGPAAIHYANKIVDEEPIRFATKIIAPDDIVVGHLLFMLGSIAFHAGIQILRPMELEGTPPRQRGSILSYALLWIVGISARWFGGLIEIFGAIIGTVTWGSFAAVCAYLLTEGASPASRRSMRFWIIALIGTAIELVTNVRTGSKAFIMYSFLPVGWLMVRTPSLRRYVPIAIAALMALYFGVVAPVVMASRVGSANEGESAGDRVVRTYMQGGYNEGRETGDRIAEMLERQYEPTPVAFIYSEVERTGLRWGETMDYLGYAFIPRLVWPEKPAVSRGGWFTLYLGAARNEREVTTSVGQTAPGELYWNFGVFGLVAGMVVLGMLFGVQWRMAGAQPQHDPLRLLLYISLIFNMVDTSEAGSQLVSIVYRMLVLGSAILVIDRLSREKKVHA
jgi:hypothetical protein